MFVDELLACLHFLRVHRIGFSHLQDEGFFEINGVVKGLSRGELSILGFIENLGIFSILWRKFLFYFLCCLGQGSGEGQLQMWGWFSPSTCHSVAAFLC